MGYLSVNFFSYVLSVRLVPGLAEWWLGIEGIRDAGAGFKIARGAFVPSPLNLLVGWPGKVFLLLASVIVLLERNGTLGRVGFSTAVSKGNG